MTETPTPVSELTSDEIIHAIGALWGFIVDANQQMARWEAAKDQWKTRWEDLCQEHRRRVAPDQPPIVWGDPTAARLREQAYRTNEKRWGYKERPSEEDRVSRRRARVARWKARQRADPHTTDERRHPRPPAGG